MERARARRVPSAPSEQDRLQQLGARRRAPRERYEMPADDQFGAKPAVLRCSRCGKFVDWEEAHVQIICTCRPRVELPPVLVREATEADRVAARELFSRDFGRTRIVAFGEIMDIDA